MIDAIVKYAGMSRGTFYTHFDSVEQAVAEAGSMLADEMVDDAKLVFAGLDSAMTRTATGIVNRRPIGGLTQIPCRFDISTLCPAHSTGVQQGVNGDGLECMGQ